MAAIVSSTLEEFSFGTVRFVREETLSGYEHPCTDADIRDVIRCLPPEDMKGIALVLFHQPTRKEELRSPRWAAYYPAYTCGETSGPAILLEAVNPEKSMKWGTSLEPDDMRELELLEREGHAIRRERKAIYIGMDTPSVRNTQVRRSFIHEVGHHVDYMRNPETFASKTKIQKEAFANAYFARHSTHSY